jgi:hypothetical protein
MFVASQRDRGVFHVKQSSHGEKLVDAKAEPWHDGVSWGD